MNYYQENVDSSKYKVVDQDTLARALSFLIYENLNPKAHYKFVLILQSDVMKELLHVEKVIENAEFLFQTIDQYHPKIVVFDSETDILGNPKLLRKTAGMMKYMKGDSSFLISKPWEMISFMAKQSKKYSKAEEVFARVDDKKTMVKLINEHFSNLEKGLTPKMLEETGLGVESINMDMPSS